jgi:hypothetical protein
MISPSARLHPEADAIPHLTDACGPPLRLLMHFKGAEMRGARDVTKIRTQLGR